MKMLETKILALIAAECLMLTTVVATEERKVTTGSALGSAEIKKVVELHNAARKEVGVEPVTWSPKLAAYAQAWADEIARTGKFAHRPSEGDWARKYGENIAMGSGDSFTAVDGARYWLEEKKNYEPGAAIPEDFSEFKAGHYSQIVWRSTKQIGLGLAVIQTGELKGATVIVGNYDPPGNVTGEKPY